MINRIYILLLLITMSFALTSCDDFLDITPEGQMERDELLSTADGIEDALYGAYSQLRTSSLYGQTLSFAHLEVMAQMMYCEGNDPMTALGQYDYTYSSIKTEFETVWTLMYKNISNVNSVLECALVKNATEYPYTIYRGEALGLRAFMHFDLMRIYCEQITLNDSASGIPYATQFSLNTPEFEKLEKNYEHVIADLLEAESLLADEAQYANTSVFMQDRQIHFNLHAVQATLARVYLTLGDKSKAYEYAKKVIDSGAYSLTTKEKVKGDLAGVLSQTETIFGVYYPKFYNVVSEKLQKDVDYSSLDPKTGIDQLYSANAGTDYRFSAYFTKENKGDDVVVYRLSKLTDVYELQGVPTSRPSSLILGVNLIRLPEMYYICAEALLDSDYDTALQYFDQVLTHRGLSKLSDPAVNGTLTQELINLEREKEFVGEGQIFFNKKRQNLDIPTTANGQVVEQLNYVVPVPDVEYENRY